MKNRLPPHNETAEINVLGALLIDPLAHATVAHVLSATDFYVHKNRFVYEAIDAAAHDGGVDFVTVADRLEATGKLETVGGSAYLTHLVANTESAMYVERHAKIVHDCATRRALILAAGNIVESAWQMEETIETVQAQSETALMSTRAEMSEHRAAAAEMAGMVYDKIEQWQTTPLAPGQTRGLATGIRAVDNALGGLEPAVYIVAARPSMGKTAMVLQMIEGIAGRGQRCLLFTLEMSTEQVGMRMATSLARVELEALRRGRAGAEAYPPLMEALGIISEWPLTIVDRSIVRPGDVLAEIRRQQIEHGDLAAVFVDGLWLMTPTRQRENRTQSLGATSREMKQVQRETNVPLVMVHQLNRSVEQRNDKRPLLSDLRNTGDIEQDADVVLMLYRDGYYNPGSERAHIAEVWVRKNRLGGQAGICGEMFWDGPHIRFVELAPCAGDSQPHVN